VRIVLNIVVILMFITIYFPLVTTTVMVTEIRVAVTTKALCLRSSLVGIPPKFGVFYVIVNKTSGHAVAQLVEALR
jgi:hypothetical protein